MVSSNKESGDGYSDILIRIDDVNIGIVIEIKYAQDGKEEEECKEALRQIIDKHYTEALERDGIHKIMKYGIACNVKRCRVMLETIE